MVNNLKQRIQDAEAAEKGEYIKSDNRKSLKNLEDLKKGY